MSPTQDQQHLCEGMAEEIMNALVPIGGIRVASRTSTFRARHDGRDLPAIARMLSVSHILEGSIRTSGNRLRVTAQLSDVASGYQLWSDRFDRDAADVFAIQDDIAAGVVEAVKARLAPGVRSVRLRSRTPNLEAYRAYLRGRHLRSKEDHAGAFQAFEERSPGPFARPLVDRPCRAHGPVGGLQPAAGPRGLPQRAPSARNRRVAARRVRRRLARRGVRVLD